MQGKYRQAVSAKAGGCPAGSSSSSGAENQKYRDPEAEIREELKRFKNAEKKQGVQDEPAGEEGRFEEDGKMKVDEEVAIKKKLDERKKKLQKQLRDLEKITDMERLRLKTVKTGKGKGKGKGIGKGKGKGQRGKG